MINFIKSRGCVVKVGTGNGGAFDISGFPKGSQGAPILLTSPNITDRDLVLPITTLSNTKILYSFGTDFGQVGLSGIICLGAGGAGNQNLSSVRQWYEANSVGNKKGATPISVSIGSEAMSIFVVGLSIAEASPQYNIVPFTIIGLKA
jgi:hypothetical protein